MVYLSVQFPNLKDAELFYEYYFGTHYQLCMGVSGTRGSVWTDLKTGRMQSRFEFEDEDAFVHAVATRAGQEAFLDTMSLLAYFALAIQKVRLGGDIKHPIRFRLRLYAVCVRYMFRWYK